MGRDSKVDMDTANTQARWAEPLPVALGAVSYRVQCTRPLKSPQVPPALSHHTDLVARTDNIWFQTRTYALSSSFFLHIQATNGIFA